MEERPGKNHQVDLLSEIFLDEYIYDKKREKKIKVMYISIISIYYILLLKKILLHTNLNLFGFFKKYIVLLYFIKKSNVNYTYLYCNLQV